MRSVKYGQRFIMLEDGPLGDRQLMVDERTAYLLVPGFDTDVRYKPTSRTNADGLEIWSCDKRKWGGDE
jgi:hypothetical protein